MPSIHGSSSPHFTDGNLLISKIAGKNSFGGSGREAGLFYGSVTDARLVKIHMPETVEQCKKLAIHGQGDAFAEQMLDIHGERLDIMTQYNVELFVLSLASPGPQGQQDKDKAEVGVPSA